MKEEILRSFPKQRGAGYGEKKNIASTAHQPCDTGCGRSIGGGQRGAEIAGSGADCARQRADDSEIGAACVRGSGFEKSAGSAVGIGTAGESPCALGAFSDFQNGGLGGISGDSVLWSDHFGGQYDHGGGQCRRFGIDCRIQRRELDCRCGHGHVYATGKSV